MRRLVLICGVGIVLGLATAPAALALESIHAYEVALRIEPSGDLLVTERLVYEFPAGAERHGIFRDVPTRLRYDERSDRLYPLEVVSVSSSTAPDGYVVEDAGDGRTRIRIGDPDLTVSGTHTYEIVYRVQGALNRFADHDELYWNAIGGDWDAPILAATATVEAPAPILQAVCFAGPVGSGLPCARARVRGRTATFVQDAMTPHEALTVVVALPRGTVERVGPILEERLTPLAALGISPGTVAGAVGLGVLLVGGVGYLLWSQGRDVVYRGSPVDQTMGGTPGLEQRVPLGDADAEAPVEFAPPEGLRPGQIGTLVDERVNTLDVTATIIDLAVRGHLRIEEVPKTWLFGKPDWRFVRLEAPERDLLDYERRLLEALFASGNEVQLSALRNRFIDDLQAVRSALYEDVVRRGWFRGRPDRVRTRWRAVGSIAVLGAGALTYALAVGPRLALLGVPAVVAALMLFLGAGRMPARTAAGTAMLRRVRGFRTVIEKAETHLARWAEEAGVFTRYLPYAIVFGCTERWAKAFETLGAGQPDTSWYVASRPFDYRGFASTMEGFTVATSGTLTSTPSGSGASGFGGGGASGGGGGGGGGGSW